MFQCFSAEPKQSASAGPQRAQVHQNLKREVSKIGAPNVFPLFQCFSAGPKQCGGPKSPRSLEKCQTSKFKNIDTKERSPKLVFLFPVSARDPNSAGPQRVQGPQRAQVPPKFKKRGPKKRGPKRFSPVSVFQRGAQTVRCPNSAAPKQCGGPKSPRSLEKCQTSKFKNIDTKERSPKLVFLFPVSARDPNSAGPQRVQGPQRAQVPPKFKKRGPKKRGPKRFFPRFSVSARGPNSAPVRGPKEPKSPKI